MEISSKERKTDNRSLKIYTLTYENRLVLTWPSKPESLSLSAVVSNSTIKIPRAASLPQ